MQDSDSRGKSVLFSYPVDYLGHVISSEGLKPSDEKVRAAADAPIPQNISQLRSFLGLLNYNAKFLPNISSILAPLYTLLGGSANWVWGRAQDMAFRKAKGLLVSTRVLVHFDPDRELIVSADASPFGIGAVLSHKFEDGLEKPIYYASRSLSAAEKGYSQLDKEGLAIVFAVKKFHQFLYGRSFSICSDHKPLQNIFDHRRSVPQMASARLQRWALVLGAYDYRINYKMGKEMGHADGLSRLPLLEAPNTGVIFGRLKWEKFPT